MFSILDRVINRPNDYIENKSSYVIIACLRENIRHSDTPSIVKTVVKKLRSIGEKHWSGRKRQRIPRRWSWRGQSAHTEKRKREIRGKRGGSDDTGKQAAEVTSCWVPNRSLGASQSPGYDSHIPSYSSSLLILHADVQDTRDTRAQPLLYAIIYK